MTELEYIEEQLRQVYTERGVQMWLYGRHRLLSQQRPIDLIHGGEAEKVLAIANQLVDGGYG